MYHLIYNPVAGRGRARANFSGVEAFFTDRNLPLNVYQTRYPGHATELVQVLPEDATVLSLGGDGTLHDVAAGCVHTGRAVGILPAGSGDDFAHALGVHATHALSVAQQGKVRPVDTGLVNAEFFINAFGVGFDADVAYELYRTPAYLKGRAAYLHAVVKTLRRLECLPVQVDVDEQRIFEGRALLVSVQNGPRTGGSFLFSPDARPNDGLFDVVIAGDLTRTATLKLLPTVMKGQHLDHPKVHIVRGRHLRLHWEKPRPAHADGELLTPTATFEASIQPKSLRMLVP